MAKTPFKSKYPIVVVQWQDAYSSDLWHNVDNVPGPAPSLTVGFLVKKTEEAIFLAMNVGEADADADFGPTFTIPMGMVTKITKIKNANA